MNKHLRKLLVVVGLTIACVVSTLPSATPTQAAPADLFVGFYRIVPLRNNAVALDAANCSGAAGTPIQLWNYWGGDCQHWYIKPTGSGYYHIESRNGGRVLDAVGCSGAAGTPIQLWSNWGGDCQQWSIVATDWNNRRYTIRSKNGGRALDMTGCSSNSGTRIQLWDYWGGDCQQWLILPATPPRRMYFSSPLSVGACTLYIDRIDFYMDGRGSFLSRVVSSRSGAVLRVRVSGQDWYGSTMFTVGLNASPPLPITNPNTTNPGTPFNVEFVYNPAGSFRTAFFNDLAAATVTASCA
jgi:hypothetical protein